MLTQATMDTYCALLIQELIPATGCTEPIAIAYAAATMRDTLGGLPESIDVAVSGNIIKNVKSVVVPGTGGRKGIAVSAAAGALAGDASRLLEVIGDITPEQRDALGIYLKNTPIVISCLGEEGLTLDIRVTGRRGADSAYVRIAGAHTNVVRIEKNGEILLDQPTVDAEHEHDAPDILNTADIVAFADEVDLDRVAAPLKKQLELNLAIAEYGLEKGSGASIGRVLLSGDDSLATRARAWAAAGSDARMSGEEKPVVILSGSGNQGITASVPVAVWAQECGYDEERLLRALIVSDLVTLHQKTGVGRLSAFCGAVCAGCGAGAGIAYLEGAGYEGVAHAVVNALAIISGMVCDGAKPSCAAKIAAAVDAGILGYRMFTQKHEFISGDGIVVKGVDNTIRNIGRLAKDGMRETEAQILSMMLETETQ